MDLKEITNYETPPRGGQVNVIGKGLDSNLKIGLGIVQFLARIPESGVNIMDLANTRIEWIRENLLPTGLVRETSRGSGIYISTEAAINAEYSIDPYLGSSSDNKLSDMPIS